MARQKQEQRPTQDQRSRDTPGRVLTESGLLALPAERALLKRYYTGQALSCVLGCEGRLERVRVQRAEAGGGKVVFECQSCSLRYGLDIPPATRTERRKVREVLEEGRDPECPRHLPRQRLGRIARELVCPLCGVAYARV